MLIGGSLATISACGGDEPVPVATVRDSSGIRIRYGQHVATIQFPARFRPARVVGEAVYGVARDEVDVEAVVRLRIVRPTIG